MVDKMFGFITDLRTISERRSVCLCGFSTLIELLRKQRVATYQDVSDPESLPSLVVAVSKHLPECTEFLNKAPLMPPMATTYGLLDPPLGLARQSVLELVESLALTNSAFVFKSLFESRFMESAIDLFFKYPWNNFAHQSVFNIIATVLPQQYRELSDHIMRDCRLIDRILEAEEENKKFYEEKRAALGFIGHLTKISSLINSLAEREHPEGLFASEVEKHNPQWEVYCTEVLKDRNERESVLLGGHRSGMGDMYFGESDTQYSHDDSDSDGEVVMCEDDEGDDVHEEPESDDVEPEGYEEAEDYREYDDEEYLEENIQDRPYTEEDEEEVRDEEEIVEEKDEEPAEEAPKEEEKKEEEAPAEEAPKEEEKKEEEAPAEEAPKEEEKKEEEAPKEEEKKEEEAPAEEAPKEEEKKEEEAPAEEAPKEEEKKEEAPAEEKKEDEAPKEEAQ